MNVINGIYNYMWPMPSQEITVSVAESITAGALANSLCAEAGSSKYFKGSIVAYSILSKKEILGIDIDYAESHNFANPFTTSEMAHAAVRMFKSRIGIATTGYSLPTYRPENKERNECELNIKIPYAYICLYDAATNHEIVKRIVFETYTADKDQNKQRAQFQAKIAIEGRNLYKEYVKKIRLVECETNDKPNNDKPNNEDRKDSNDRKDRKDRNTSNATSIVV